MVRSEMYRWAVDDQVPNAIMLHGRSAKGSLALALDFIQYLYCSERSDQKPCGQCPSCSKTKQFIHPDVHFSFPVVGTNKTSNDFIKEWREILHIHPYFSLFDWLRHIGVENQQGNISKNECANIIRSLSFRGFESARRVVCMWLPEYLQKEGNRLLKLIEEPPEETTFLFTTEQPQQILTTILSRCRLVRVPPLAHDEALDELTGIYGMERSEAESLYHVYDGALNEIIGSRTESDDAHSEMFKDWIRFAYQQKVPALLDWVDAASRMGRERLKQFFKYASHLIAEAERNKIRHDRPFRLTDKELEIAKWLGLTLSFGAIERIFTIFEETTRAIERNASAKIQLTNASIQLKNVFKMDK